MIPLTQSAHGHVALEVLTPRSPELAFQLKCWQDEQSRLEARLARLADDPLTPDAEYLACAQEVAARRETLAAFARQALRRTQRLEWDNLILDNGLTQVAAYPWAQLFQYCVVGTGNSTPTNSQQALDAEAARTANYLTGSSNCGTTRPASNVWVLKRTFDFPLGALNGTYAEVGFSPLSSPGPNLFSRSLIQSSGVPTAVTVSSSQQLRVVYTLTITLGSLTIGRDVPNISGWTTLTPSGSVTASQTGSTVTASGAAFGPGDVNKAILFADGSFAVITAYTSATQVTVDRSQMVSAQTFNLLSGTTGQIALQNLPDSTISNVYSTGTYSTGDLEPSRSSIGAFVSSAAVALATPGTNVNRQSGYSYFNGAAQAQPYTSGLKRNFKFSMTVNDANFNNIRSVGLSAASGGSEAASGTLVFLFDNDQSKNNLYTLEFIFTLSWGRN